MLTPLPLILFPADALLDVLARLSPLQKLIDVCVYTLYVCVCVCVCICIGMLTAPSP